MLRKRVFILLRFLHVLVENILMKIVGGRFRQQYIRLSYKIKTRLFPEYGSYVPTAAEVSSPLPHNVWLPPSIPDWVLEEMRVLGKELDPILYPTEQFIASCQYYSYSFSLKPGRLYDLLIGHCSSSSYSHCFAIPWLKRGGADLVALKHIELACKQPNAKVLIILTEPSESHWLHKIPSNADVLDVSKYVFEVSHDELLLIIVRLLVQLNISVLHIINSRHVWEVVCKYGLAITQNTKIYASIYCDDYDKYNQPVGFARQYLGNCYKYITNVFSDNARFPELLCQTYGYSSDLFKVIKVPAPIHDYPVRSKSEEFNVLWAGRLDRQKRPDILLAIAEALPQVNFSIFGSVSLDAPNKIVSRLAKLLNVKILGAYDGPESLPFGSHRLFLYTSQWDGMPNMVLEAMSAGIPLVCSVVGGIRETLNEKRGFPIDEIENIDAYVRAIRYVLDHPDEAEKRAVLAKQYVRTEHTQSKFEAGLTAVNGYLN